MHSSVPDRSLPSHRLFTSAFNVLQEAPPPSLREILGAYKTRGDGDRDMLLAMLNAKSAEDQRLASVASLHRTLLEVSSLDAKHPPSTSPPSLPSSSSCHGHDARYISYPGDVPVPRLPPPMMDRCSKRPRSSRSPRSPPSHSDVRTHLLSRDLPPSPYSSSRSGSEEYSPRSKASMAIGSLLSSGPTRDSLPDGDPRNSDQPHMSS